MTHMIILPSSSECQAWWVLSSKKCIAGDVVFVSRTLQLDIGNAYKEITEIKFEAGRPFDKVTAPNIGTDIRRCGHPGIAV